VSTLALFLEHNVNEYDLVRLNGAQLRLLFGCDHSQILIRSAELPKLHPRVLSDSEF